MARAAVRVLLGVSLQSMAQDVACAPEGEGREGPEMERNSRRGPVVGLAEVSEDTTDTPSMDAPTRSKDMASEGANVEEADVRVKGENDAE